jgi:ATP-dependent Clp protease adaptor protein ClpS
MKQQSTEKQAKSLGGSNIPPSFKEYKMSAQTDIILDEKIKVNVTEPKKYKVIFLNDDTTPMEFVISVLMEIFKHSEQNATNITVKVHEEGSEVVGIYAHEIAEQKAVETTNLARNHGFQLQVKIEEE